MARKSNKPVAESAIPAPEIVPEPIAAPEPVPEPVESLAILDAPAVPEPAAAATVDDTLAEVFAEVGALGSVHKKLTAYIRQLQKQVTLLQKETQKLRVENLKLAKAVSAAKTARGGKRAKPDTPSSDTEGAPTKKSISGICKPVELAETLCTFLDLPIGTKMARMDVTRLLNAYIKTHELYDPSDKRKIIADDKLKTILSDTENLTYFNMQAKIKDQFIKAPPAVPVA